MVLDLAYRVPDDRATVAGTLPTERMDKKKPILTVYLDYADIVYGLCMTRRIQMRISNVTR